MHELTKSYRLKRFASSKDPDYTAALSVYISTAIPEIRTSSNQITYWLDRTYTEFGDELCFCGLYVDDRVVGFAEFAFFRKSALVFFDYLSLHPDYQSQSEYLQFAKLLREWIDRQPIEFDFAATEITFNAGSSEPSARSLLEVQLYKQMGFGVAHCKYQQPPLGTHNPQSDQAAYLMLTGNTQISSLRKDALLQVVRTVYFDHYLRWFTPFLEDPDDYKRALSERLRKTAESISDVEDVKVNGSELWSRPVPHAIVENRRAEPATGRSLLVLFCLLLFIGSLLALNYVLQLPWQAVGIIIGSSLFAVVAVFALFHEPSRDTFESMLGTISKIGGRRK